MIEPMLGKLVRELPVGDYIYEPKWDGFRCIAYRDGDKVDLRSRNAKAFARYFPEVVKELLALPEQHPRRRAARIRLQRADAAPASREDAC